jgi:hypothetical protein
VRYNAVPSAVGDTTVALVAILLTRFSEEGRAQSGTLAGEGPGTFGAGVLGLPIGSSGTLAGEGPGTFGAGVLGLPIGSGGDQGQENHDVQTPGPGATDPNLINFLSGVDDPFSPASPDTRDTGGKKAPPAQPMAPEPQSPKENDISPVVDPEAVDAQPFGILLPVPDEYWAQYARQQAGAGTRRSEVIPPVDSSAPHAGASAGLPGWAAGPQASLIEEQDVAPQEPTRAAGDSFGRALGEEEGCDRGVTASAAQAFFVLGFFARCARRQQAPLPGVNVKQRPHRDQGP